MKAIAIEFSVIRVYNDNFHDFPGDEDGKLSAIRTYQRASEHPKSIDVIDVNLTAEPWAILDFIRSCQHYHGVPDGLACGAFVTSSRRVRETTTNGNVSTDHILDPAWES